MPVPYDSLLSTIVTRTPSDLCVYHRMPRSRSGRCCIRHFLVVYFPLLPEGPREFNANSRVCQGAKKLLSFTCLILSIDSQIYPGQLNPFRTCSPVLGTNYLEIEWFAVKCTAVGNRLPGMMRRRLLQIIVPQQEIEGTITIAHPEGPKYMQIHKKLRLKPNPSGEFEEWIEDAALHSTGRIRYHNIVP